MKADGRRCLVIHNPVAGQRHGGFFGRTLAALVEEGCRIDVRATTGRGDAEDFARAACSGAWDVVVAAGGDGTINEVVNGLAGSAMPLALLPLGTANVLAAEIGLPLRPHVVARAIARGMPRTVRLGRVSSPAGSRHFILMAGIGFDAHVVRDIDSALKRRFGKLAYVAECLRQARIFPYPVYRLTADGVVINAASAVIANGRSYGGPYSISPAAALDLPSLSLCLFEGRGTRNVIRYGTSLVLGLLPRLRDFRIVEATRIDIDGPEGDPVQGDGDIIASLPASITLSPETLMLICA